ncbi:hypothetical protein BH10CYA1_BH10CYA1_28730 [soil metagenome]
MGDSPKFNDSQAVPQDSVGNFGNLAQKILDVQIATRNPQSGNSDSSNIALRGKNPVNAPLPESPQEWWHSEPRVKSPEPVEPNPNIQSPSQPWRPLQIDPPVWTPPTTWRPSQPSILPNLDRTTLDLQRIPTLHVNQPPNQYDRSIYNVSSEEAKIYNANRDSIVRVYGHGIGQAPDREFTGTGFFVSNHGDIATAYHVISHLESIRVTTSDGIAHPAKIIATKETADVAIIHIDTSQSTKPVTLADTSNLLHGGAPLFTIGHPAGWRNEFLSTGRYQSTDTARDINFYHQIHAQNPNHILLTVSQNIQGGDSGGPVFDSAGKVMGIVSLGDDGHHGYMVSVNDLWPLMDKVSEPKQSTNYKQSDVPFKLHFGIDEGAYALTSALSISQMLGKSAGFQRLGGVGQSIAAGWSATELWNQDLPFLRTAFDHGTTREKVSAIASVGGDVLLIGGAVSNFIPKLRTIAPAVSLAGSLLKLGNGAAAFRTYS